MWLITLLSSDDTWCGLENILKLTFKQEFCQVQQCVICQQLLLMIKLSASFKIIHLFKTSILFFKSLLKLRIKIKVEIWYFTQGDPCPSYWHIWKYILPWRLGCKGSDSELWQLRLHFVTILMLIPAMTCDQLLSHFSSLLCHCNLIASVGVSKVVPSVCRPSSSPESESLHLGLLEQLIPRGE